MLCMLEQTLGGQTCVAAPLSIIKSSVFFLVAQLLAAACWTAELKRLLRGVVELAVPARLLVEVPVVAVAVR